MSGHTSLNTFIFSDKIDAVYIYEMYENDYGYIETMFKAILDGFEEDLAAIRDNYLQKNLESLRKSIHKIKPTFGFAGMLDIQEKCKEFESKCQVVKSVGELETDFPAFIKCLEEAGVIVMEEYKKLEAFNNSGS
jgi:hypothetical protein